jgi:hypothetical protein
MNDYDAEFREHLRHVFEIQRWEQERDRPATPDWFAIISNTAILARMLRDENTDPDVDAALARAIGTFEAAMADFSTYLTAPPLPAAITDFIEAVEERLA